ncbi:hypothetical protein Tco_0395164, partial [Tanacetum coccineum]
KPDLYTKSPKLRANISECQTLIKKNGITLSLITSEENKCAHFLAKLAMDDVDDEHEDVLDPHPDQIYTWLKASFIRRLTN